MKKLLILLLSGSVASQAFAATPVSNVFTQTSSSSAVPVSNAVVSNNTQVPVQNNVPPPIPPVVQPQAPSKVPVQNTNSSAPIPPMKTVTPLADTGAISALDSSNKNINEIKRQTALLKAQNDLAAQTAKSQSVPPLNNGNMPTMIGGNTPTAVQPDVVTASMKSYIGFRDGKKLATIMFANGATVEVEKGTVVQGYQVTSMTPDGLTLTKLNSKNQLTKTRIKLAKNFPIEKSSNSPVNGGYDYQATIPTFNTAIPLSKGY